MEQGSREQLQLLHFPGQARLFDQTQYIPELADVVVDAYELRVQVVLSLDNSLKQGQFDWPRGDVTTEEDNLGRHSVPPAGLSLPRN